MSKEDYDRESDEEETLLGGENVRDFEYTPSELKRFEITRRLFNCGMNITTIIGCALAAFMVIWFIIFYFTQYISRNYDSATFSNDLTVLGDLIANNISLSNLLLSTLTVTNLTTNTITTSTLSATSSVTAPNGVFNNLTVYDELVLGTGTIRMRNNAIEGAKRIGLPTDQVTNIYANTVTASTGYAVTGSANFGSSSSRAGAVFAQFADLSGGISFATDGTATIGSGSVKAGNYFGTGASFSANVLVTGNLGDVATRIGNSAYGVYTTSLSVSANIEFSTNQTSLIGTPSVRANALYIRSVDASGAVVASSFVTASDPVVKRYMIQTEEETMVSKLMNIKTYHYQYTEEFADYSGRNPNITITGFNATQIKYEVDSGITTEGTIIPERNGNPAVTGTLLEQGKLLPYAIEGAKAANRKVNVILTVLNELIPIVVTNSTQRDILLAVLGQA